MDQRIDQNRPAPHGHYHPHAPNSSFFRASATRRLLLAAGATLCLWLIVFWAMA
jgi:hypothetical protein